MLREPPEEEVVGSNPASFINKVLQYKHLGDREKAYNGKTDSKLIARGFKMYPDPFKREGTNNLSFNYIDPLTGKRKLKSCGTARVGEAKKIIKEFIDSLTVCSGLTFRQYAQRYCSYETNPRAQRLKLDGKYYSVRYSQDLKEKLEKYVFPDSFCDKTLSEISRGDVIDLKQRMASRNPDRIPTINKTMKHIAAIFSEGYLRGDIKTNPAQQLSSIAYTPQERGFFSAEEIFELFKDPNKWQSLLSYQVFQFAAYTGRRASEILALEWEQIEGKYCTIDRAWKKAEGKSGSPKWGVSVKIPLPGKLNFPEKSMSPYVFNDDGRRLGETWWRKNFIKAMELHEIDYKSRNFTPHSFRHSLNTNLLLSGCPELYVKKYLGWTDKSRDTQSHYTHIQPEHLVVVSDKIDEIYSGKSKIVEFVKTG
jgi:integrase